ncbi:MAG: RNA polymerase sigma factor [Nannocystales bacterium]
MNQPGSTDRFSATDLAQLRSLARSLVSVQEADDLAHEGWIASHGASHDGHPAWWRTVLRRRRDMTVRSDLRRQSREARTEAGHTEATPPDAALQRNELCEALQRALAHLDPQDRDLVLRRYCEGHTAGELSTEFGLPSSTVRTRLSRSLQRMRDHLDRTGGRAAWMSAAVAWSPESLTSPGVLAVSTSTTTKAIAATAFGSLLVACIAMTQDDTEAPDESELPAATATATAATKLDATSDDGSAKGRRKRWESLRGAIASRRAKRDKPDSEPSVLGDRTHEDVLAEMEDELQRFEALGPLMASVLEQGVPLFVECLEALPKGATGKLHLRADVIGEPELGAIVESVEVVDDSLDEPAVEECLRESAYSIALESVDEPVSKSLNITVDMADRSLSVNTNLDLEHFVDMPTRDPELWAEMMKNPKALENLSKLLEVPKIVEEHPEFAASLEAALAASKHAE